MEKNLCTDPNDFNEELTYIKKTMELNDFPENIVKKTIKNHLKKRDKPRKENDDVQQQIPLYLPYEKGISEKISRLAKKYNVKVVNKKGKSLENILKTKDNTLQKI